MTKKQLNLLKLLIINERDYYQQLTKESGNVSPKFVSPDIRLVEVLPSLNFTARALVRIGLAEYVQGNDNPHIRLVENLNVN